MANFNQVAIAGTLGQDPQVRYTPSGTAVCEVSIAVNRHWFDKQSNSMKSDVTWVPVVLWGKTAENVGKYLGKGSSVLVGGRLEESVWDDKQTGQKRSRLKVVGEVLQMLGQKQKQGEQREQRQDQEPQSGYTFGSDAGTATATGSDDEYVPF